MSQNIIPLSILKHTTVIKHATVLWGYMKTGWILLLAGVAALPNPTRKGKDAQ